MFQVGEPRHEKAGRKKNTPNLSTQYLAEMAEELGLHPFKILLLFAGGRFQDLGYESNMKLEVTKDGVKETERITAELRVAAASQAARYLYCQRKATDITIDDKQRAALDQYEKLKNVPKADLIQLAERRIQELKTG